MTRNRAYIKEDRKAIFEIIDKSWEKAQKKGLHPLERGCNCIVCVNKRKRLVEDGKKFENMSFRSYPESDKPINLEVKAKDNVGKKEFYNLSFTVTHLNSFNTQCGLF